jgi:hypothetical protein
MSEYVVTINGQAACKLVPVETAPGYRQKEKTP